MVCHQRGGFNLTLPLRTEWRHTNQPAPDFICESSVEVNLPYTPNPPAVPAETTGMPHLHRDGTISRELRSDSVLAVSVYGFGPGNFRPDKYGLKVRDEMEAAGLMIEAGGINAYNPQHGDWKQSLHAFEQKRIADGEDLKLWRGDWSATDDDAMGPDALAALMQQPGWEGYFDGWCEWRNTATARRPLFSIYKDEVNAAFGGDPEDGNQRLISKFHQYGGVKAFVDALRSACGHPIAPGMFGVGSEVPVGYTKWTLPEYADFVDQYVQYNDLPAPWSGQTLRHMTTTQGWAAKHRDQSRPLALNYGLITKYELKQADGSWKQTIPSSDPKTIPAQLWMCLAYGATVLRGYAMAAFDLPRPDDVPAGSEYQHAVRPGSDEYYALLSSTRMIKDYEPLLLGSEQPLMDAGPDFMVLHRLGPRGRIWAAVNLSERERMIPLSAVPDFKWTAREQLHADGHREFKAVTLGMVVPPNGVLVLSQVNQ